jgi:hypothetical protein
MSEHDSHDDPVARNRAVHPRKTPGRPQMGDDTLRLVMKVAGIAVGLATVVLLLVLTV